MSKASLRTRLIFIASAFVTLIWLSAIVIVAFNLKLFLDRLIDIELERDMRLSRHLYQIIAPNLDPDLKGLEALHNDVGIISSLQGEWGFKTYSSDGELYFGSTHVPDFPLPREEGFFDMTFDGEVWRVHAQRMDDDIWTVVTANKSGANRLVLQNLSPTPWFLLLILPLTVLAAIYGIHRATRPIVELEQTVRQRSPRSLEPLAQDNVPVEVEPLVSAVNQLLARVQKLVDHEHRFVANAAHELQTPLAAMKTELQNSRHQTDDPALTETLARLERRVNRSVYSVKQLLTLARLDPEAPLTRDDSANIEHIVFDELAACGDDLLRNNLATDVRCAGATLARCNRELVVILVRNLVENAIKYALPDSEIEISADTDDGALTLCVANDCAPMPVATMQQLRDSFFRVPGNDATGVGLGLAIVDRIANLHGGGVDFRYRNGEDGLAVTVVFPA